MRNLNNILFRIAHMRSAERFADTVERTARARWEVDFEKGAAPYSSIVHQGFHDHVTSEIKRLEDLGGPAAEPNNIAKMQVQAWAAHFLPVDLYMDFFRTNLLHPLRWGCPHAVAAKTAAAKVRDFPEPSSAKPQEKKSVIESAATYAAREIWQHADPLITYQDTREDITRALADLSADDLHALAHGEDVTDAPIIEAVAKHPKCDWGSALEILHSFSASVYQGYWALDKSEADYGEEDQALFRAFQAISDRANSGGFQSSKFLNNMRIPPLTLSDGSANPEHPANWVKWAIPAEAMVQTEGLQHQPEVIFDAGKISLTFEGWQKAQAQKQSA